MPAPQPFTLDADTEIPPYHILRNRLAVLINLLIAKYMIDTGESKVGLTRRINIHQQAFSKLISTDGKTGRKLEVIELLLLAQELGIEGITLNQLLCKLIYDDRLDPGRTEIQERLGWVKKADEESES